jgi:hypothetical protein
LDARIISLHSFLVGRHLCLPAETTMIENTNQIGAATQEPIFKRQIEDILEEGLDDFKALTIDSTGVVANTAWPINGKTLVGLIGRTCRAGRKPNRFLRGILNSVMKTFRHFPFLSSYHFAFLAEPSFITRSVPEGSPPKAKRRWFFKEK